MDFVTASTGLISPYWMGLPIRYIQPEYKDYYPALLVELKWNHNVQSALDQIKEKVYPQSIQEYTDNLLLVGITYDSKTKEHRCKIEKF